MKTLSPILDKIKVGIALFAASAGIALAQSTTTPGTGTGGGSTILTPGTPTTALGGLLSVNASFLVLAISLIAIGLFLLLGSKKYSL